MSEGRVGHPNRIRTDVQGFRDLSPGPLEDGAASETMKEEQTWPFSVISIFIIKELSSLIKIYRDFRLISRGQRVNARFFAAFTGIFALHAPGSIIE